MNNKNSKLNSLTNLRIILIIIFLAIISFLTFCFFNYSKKQDSIKNYNFSNIETNPRAINIVFATDRRYIKYLEVAIKSAIVNKNKDSYYNIYILGVNLNKKEIEELENYKTDTTKIKVLPLDQSMLKGIKHKTFFHHVSKTDYFKFFMPEIFNNLDKILYLDCDILVLGDLGELYHVNVEDKYIAVIQRFSYPIDLKETRYNIGVILYNLDFCRRNDLTNKLIRTKNNLKDSNSVTQAAFVKTIPAQFIETFSPIYNNRTKTTQQDFEQYNYKKNYSKFFKGINNLEDLDKKTVIVHFADYKKPWFDPTIKFGQTWWHYARMINPSWKVEKRTLKEKLIEKIYKLKRNIK